MIGPPERLLHITAAIANAVTSSEVFVALVDGVAQAVGASSAGLFILDEEGQRVELVRSLGYNDEARAKLATLPVDLEPSIPALDAIRERRALWIPSKAALSERYPHLASMLSPERSYRVACLPLVAHARVLGCLGITIEEAAEAGDEERELLSLVARYAGQALERLRLLEAEKKHRAVAEQLFGFARAVVAADRVEVVYEAAIAAIESALDVRRAAVLTYDSDGVMRFRAWRNLSERYRRSVEGHSPWPPDAAEPEPVLVPDVARDPSMSAHMPLFQSEGIGALAFVPLVSRGRLLGKFMLYYPEPHAFLAQEVATARAIANHLGSVVARFAAMAKLEETVHMSELFAGVLAHDLRTPLGAMIMSGQYLLMRREHEGSSDEREDKHIARILSSGKRMTVMIDQLLDLTRARSGGRIDVEPVPTDLAELAAHSVAELELTHPDWRIGCEVLGDARGTWDPDRMLQVLSNLLSNAGQHGAPGTRITLKLDGTHPERLRVSVHNHGAIPEAVLPHIFDPFRSTRHRRDRSCGLGLGLFVVREVVHAHAGTIEVQSSEACGTSFSLELPRHAPGAQGGGKGPAP